jgi:hypothetical protein
VNTLASAAAFVLCVVAYSAGPLIAPTRPARRHTPAWAHSRAQARRIARTTRKTPDTTKGST